MPNHIKNVLKFNNLKGEDIRFLLDTITTPTEDPDTKVFHHVMDFDRIIPQPRVESDCPKDCIVNKDSHIEINDDRSWFNWYEWNTKYWGTKWNAYDNYIATGKSYITLVFCTAWNTPFPIINRLTLLGYNFQLKYADEDYGRNCGKIIYNPEKTGFSSTVHISSSDLKNPEKFAKNLWDKY